MRENEGNTLLITDSRNGKIVTIATFEDAFILEVIAMHLEACGIPRLHCMAVVELFGFGEISFYETDRYSIVWIDPDNE